MLVIFKLNTGIHNQHISPAQPAVSWYHIMLLIFLAKLGWGGSLKLSQRCGTKMWIKSFLNEQTSTERKSKTSIFVAHSHLPKIIHNHLQSKEQLWLVICRAWSFISSNCVQIHATGLTVFHNIRYVGLRTKFHWCQILRSSFHLRSWHHSSDRCTASGQKLPPTGPTTNDH